MKLILAVALFGLLSQEALGGYVHHRMKRCSGDYVYPPIGIESLDEAKTACNENSDCKCITVHKCSSYYGIYYLHKGTAMKKPPIKACSWIKS